MDQDYTKQMAQTQASHWWYEGRRDILRSIIGRLNIPKTAKIVEAGCGPGANLRMLSEFGEVSAFEPEDFSIDYASKTSGVNVQKGGLPDAVPFENKFDLVCAFDVLEHIEDDLTSLKALYAKTLTGGYAVFTVPAFAFLWSRHDELNHHHRRYTKGSFEKVLKDAGYKIEFISYFNFWLFPIAASVRLLKNTLGKNDDGSETEMPSPFINKMLCKIFTSEKCLLKCFSLPFGLSLIAVCKKPEGS